MYLSTKVHPLYIVTEIQDSSYLCVRHTLRNITKMQPINYRCVLHKRTSRSNKFINARTERTRQTGTVNRIEGNRERRRISLWREKKKKKVIARAYRWSLADRRKISISFQLPATSGRRSATLAAAERGISLRDLCRRKQMQINSN